jgi:hypothetical protein
MQDIHRLSLIRKDGLFHLRDSRRPQNRSLSNGAALMSVYALQKASDIGACGGVQRIRDAVVAITVRVGVKNVGRVDDVPSAANVLRGAAASVMRTLSAAGSEE